ncbi:MAG TPA: hypothetical protein VF746_15175 [Longimicrobium sp.]|jgi:hypothetical protein
MNPTEVEKAAQVTSKAPQDLWRAYLEWVQQQVEKYKESIPRSHLLAIADQVVSELRISKGGQYQLTELLLGNAVDRYLAQMLKLPGYHAWVDSTYRGRSPSIPASIPTPVLEESVELEPALLHILDHLIAEQRELAKGIAEQEVRLGATVEWARSLGNPSSTTQLLDGSDQ